MFSPKSLCSLTTISLVSVLLLFSILSLSFIFYFRLKTLRSNHLRDFNSLWPVRILLVSFAFLWSLTELLRLPLFDHESIFPFFLPSITLTLTQRETLCKIYLVSSLGLFQPCFFLTLFFLVKISLKKEGNYENALHKAISVVFLSCLPVFFSQVFFVFFARKVWSFWKPPEVFCRYFVVLSKTGQKGGKVLQCAHPLISTGILGGFGAVYVVCFVGVCWRAVSLVINRRLRARIYGLAFAVVSGLSTQFLSLAVSVIWKPGEVAFETFSVLAFLSVLSCALVGEGILVIQPMADALIVEGSLLLGGSCSSSRRSTY